VFAAEMIMQVWDTLLKFLPHLKVDWTFYIPWGKDATQKFWTYSGCIFLSPSQCYLSFRLWALWGSAWSTV